MLPLIQGVIARRMLLTFRPLPSFSGRCFHPLLPP